MTPDLSTEQAILDLLSDEDDEVHAGQALSTLVDVVAGICCLATNSTPEALAEGFVAVLLQRVRLGQEIIAEERRLLS